MKAVIGGAQWNRKDAKSAKTSQLINAEAQRRRVIAFIELGPCWWEDIGLAQRRHDHRIDSGQAYGPALRS